MSGDYPVLDNGVEHLGHLVQVVGFFEVALDAIVVGAAYLFPGGGGAGKDEGDGFFDEMGVAVDHLFELQAVHIGHVHGGDDHKDGVFCGR